MFSGEEEEEVVCQESQVTQEMLEEQLVRLLTRELLDLLCKFSSCLVEKLNFHTNVVIVVLQITYTVLYYSNMHFLAMLNVKLRAYSFILLLYFLFCQLHKLKLVSVEESANISPNS